MKNRNVFKKNSWIQLSEDLSYQIIYYNLEYFLVGSNILPSSASHVYCILTGTFQSQVMADKP